MAVAFDAVASTGLGFAAPATDNTTNITVVSASNGYIVVGVGVGVLTPSNITGVTIGGSAAALLGTVNSNNGSSGGVAVYGRVNASTGTVACVVSLTSISCSLNVGVISFTGVHQTVSAGTAVTAFGSSGTASVSLAGQPGTAGDLAVYNLCQGSGGASTPGTNETERYDLATDGLSSAGSGAGGHSTDIAGTITSTFTSDDWGIVALNLLQASAGGRTTKNIHPSELGINLGIGYGHPGGEV